MLRYPLLLVIQKLKSKHTSLKKYTNWAKLIYFSLVLREREEKKPNVSHLLSDINCDWKAASFSFCELTNWINFWHSSSDGKSNNELITCFYEFWINKFTKKKKNHKISLLHFVAFFPVASLLSTGVENEKVGVDNEKALELTNSTC